MSSLWGVVRHREKQPVTLTFDDVARALLSSDWIFAKTMPEIPHWYTLRKRWAADLPPFEDVVQFIRDYGYREKFGRNWFTRLDINGLKYWSMGAPLPITILINRAVIETLQPYDRVAESYDALWASPEAQAEDRRIMEAVAYQGGDVLDIGCGTGLFLDHVKPEGYLGIDPSAGMLERLKAKHPAAEVIRTRFESFAPLGRTFDLIVGLYCASYIDPKTLKRIPRLLKPGGRFFLMFYREGYQPVTHSHLTAPPAWLHYDPASLPGRRWSEGNFDIVEGP